MILIILSAAWVLGLYAGSFLRLSPHWMLLGLAPLLFFFFKAISRRLVIMSALSVLLLISGTLYGNLSGNRSMENDIGFYNDTVKVELKGMVARDPDIRDKSVQLLLKTSAVQTEDGWKAVNGKALIIVPRYPEYHYGDILQIKGIPVAPPQLGDFDYKGYLEHQGIYTVISFPKIEVMETGRGLAPLAGIYRLRAMMGQKLAEVLPEPQASLAQGILLGLRGNIPDDLNTAFSRSGSSHLLAISGYNLTVMAGLLLAVGVRILGRRRYLYVWLALAAVWFYTIITGLNPPVIRGAIMASIFLFAEALGRQRSAAAALFLTAAVMAGIHPYILGDVSFQLSFTAMAGLIFIHPIFNGWAKNIAEKTLGGEGWRASLFTTIAEMFSVSIAAIIAVWPLLAYYFGMFAWTGPLATFLLTFIQPFIIVIGMLAALGGLAFHGLGQFFGWLLWPLLTYMIAVVYWLGGTGSAANIEWVGPWFIAVYYPGLFLLIFAYERRQRIKSLFAGGAGRMKTGMSFGFSASGAKLLVIPLIILAILTTFTALTMPDKKLRVSFLDVGQGDAVLIKQGNTQVLIDGGPSPQAVMLALSKAMPFWDRTIEAVILTHPHQDHLAGLIEVVKRYKVKMAIFALSDYASPLLDEWRALIKEKQINTVPADNTKAIKIGGSVTLNILNPSPVPLSGTESDVDNNSLAVSVHGGDVSFLITGDMMREAERQLIWNRAGVACTVLKAAHHGSDTSTTPEFLTVANPRVVVISSGAGNKYGLPNQGTIERLGEKAGQNNVYRTDLRGTIDFTTDGKRLWVKTEK